MYNIIDNGTVEEENLKRIIVEASQADKFEQTVIAETDIEAVNFYHTGKGDRFAKVRFISADIAKYFFWLEGSEILKVLQDGKGRSGVKLVEDKPMIARQRCTDQRMDRDARSKGGRRSDWASVARGGMVAQQSVATIDYDILADKVADRLATKLAQQNGAFLQATASVINSIVHQMMKQLLETKLTPIRNGLEDVYDAVPAIEGPHAPQQNRLDERRGMEMEGPASERRLRVGDTADEMAFKVEQEAARFRASQSARQQVFTEQAQLFQQQPQFEQAQAMQQQQFDQQQLLLGQLAALQQQMPGNNSFS